MCLTKLRSFFKSKQELELKLKVLEDLVQRLTERAWTITVENLSIENLHLDKLEFYLDKIDVDQLNGILNVGLNNLTEGTHNKYYPRKPLGAYLTKSGK